MTPIDVADLDPGEAHILVREAVTAAAAGIGYTETYARAALNGRSRIIGRHRPSSYLLNSMPACEQCLDEGLAGEIAPVAWPCADYVDASAGLVVGLPGKDPA